MFTPAAGPAALVAALRRVCVPFHLVDAGAGPANFYFAQDRTARGQHGDAAVAARLAIARLLRRPDAAVDARIHLGVRDADLGVDPDAALASAPWLAAARAALASGDLAAARAALAQAREFAGRDADTLETIVTMSDASK